MATTRTQAYSRADFRVPAVDFCHSAAMLSLRRIKSFVFARLASPRREFSARLAVQKQSFYSPKNQHGRRVTKVYSL